MGIALRRLLCGLANKSSSSTRMDSSQNASDDAEANRSVSKNPKIKYRPMPDPLSVYVPLKSLTQQTVDSIVSTVHQSGGNDWHFGRRTLLAFLLAIDEQLTQIEQNLDAHHQFDEETIANAPRVREWLVRTTVYDKTKPIEWDQLRTEYQKLSKQNDTRQADYFQVDSRDVEPYYELTISGLHPDVNQSREYMAQFRSSGWKPQELKVYWDAKQLEDLCPREQLAPRPEQEATANVTTEQVDDKDAPAAAALEGAREDVEDTKEPTKEQINNKDAAAAEEAKEDLQDTKAPTNQEISSEDAAALEGVREDLQDTKEPTKEQINNKDVAAAEEAREDVEDTKAPVPVTSELFLHDPSDADAVHNLRLYPVRERNHAVKITYVNKGIERAVFDAPEDAQLIVLNFANERSPGGGYLRHAWAQEEIILFNSDGYRSLLDLKYGRMGGGYVIPEFGTAYVRDIRFFEKGTDRIRKADMLVSACYCVSGSSQLFENPGTEKEWFDNNEAKFRAFIAAAVANTKGDGSNTYLLLGPIGTGAFGNDTREIGDVFDKVLSSQMMGSTGPIRNAFGNIWFVSTDKWKNEVFEEIFKGWSSDQNRF